MTQSWDHFEIEFIEMHDVKSLWGKVDTGTDLVSGIDDGGSGGVVSAEGSLVVTAVMFNTSVNTTTVGTDGPLVGS